MDDDYMGEKIASIRTEQLNYINKYNTFLIILKSRLCASTVRR